MGLGLLSPISLSGSAAQKRQPWLRPVGASPGSARSATHAASASKPSAPARSQPVWLRRLSLPVRQACRRHAEAAGFRPAVIAATAQGFTAVLLGLTTGAKMAERWRELTERLAGITLIVLGAYLIAEQLTR